MPKNAPLLSPCRISGHGAATPFVMMMTIITITTRSRGASG